MAEVLKSEKCMETKALVPLVNLTPMLLVSAVVAQPKSADAADDNLNLLVDSAILISTWIQEKFYMNKMQIQL